MKANRKFVNSDEAVSPVIAVILMVAITVVLAATVFVLVSDIGTQGKTAIAVNFSTDEGQDRLVVQSTSQGADWNRVALKLSAAPSGGAIVNLGTATPYQGDAAVAGGADLSATTNTQVTASTDIIDATEFLEFCGTASDGTTSAAVSNVIILVIDTDANQQIGSYTFSEVSGC